MNDLIDEIMQLVDRLQSGFDRFVAAVNSALDWVPSFLSWVVDQVERLWDQLVSAWQEFWDRASYIFGNLGDPGALETTGQAWSSEVGGPVSAQAGLVARGILQADDQWKGTAASQYFQKASLQESALGAIQGLADKATEAMDNVRAGLTKFYLGLVIALGALLAGIYGAIVATGTIVGIPAGFVAFVIAILIAGGSILTGALLLESDCRSAQSNLDRAMTGNNLGFPGGSWPPGAVV